MSLNDENSNAEGGNGFLSSTDTLLGEKTKKDESAHPLFRLHVRTEPKSWFRPLGIF